LAAAVFSVSGGEAFLSLGSWAPILLQAFMPARMLAVVPLAAAAAIVVAVDGGLGRLEVWSRRREDRFGESRRRQTLARVFPVAVLLLAALYCSPGSAHVFYENLAAPGDAGFVEASCDPPGWAGSMRTKARWIRALDRGRFEIDAHAPFARAAESSPSARKHGAGRPRILSGNAHGCICQRAPMARGKCGEGRRSGCASSCAGD
jgi:hypothetical protein